MKSRIILLSAAISRGRRGAVALARVALPLLIVAAPGASLASDHADGPSTALDRTGDISDLYTFMSPQDPDKVVMIMNVLPFASHDSLFSDKVSYRFRIRPIEDAETLVPSADKKKEQAVVCTFSGKSAKQKATCSFKLGGSTEKVSFSTLTGSEGGSGQKGDLRVFAGARSDSFFSDFERTTSNVNNGLGIDTKKPGTNGDEGANVLSIVVEFDRKRLSTPLVAVTAQTTRR